jgi:FkbH-like protein
MTMKSFSELKKNLKKDFSVLEKVKLAVLGDTATQFLAQALRGVGYDAGLDLQLWEADFDSIDRQVFDSAAELYAFKPDIILLFQSSHKLLGKFNKSAEGAHPGFATAELESIGNIFTTLQSRLGAKVIYYNYPEIDDSVFGNFAAKTTSSFLFQLRKLNYELMVYAATNPDFFLCDLSTIQNRIGRQVFFQPSIYVNTEMVLSIEALPHVAARTISLINALKGRFKKCLILDLDNTIWGGVIGEDGLENIELGTLGIGKAFSEFQHWIRKLQKRGIIIAVCSKNTDAVARKPFEKHPDMVLKLEDIAVFRANWDNKADNIRDIQRILNIGFDSMVFLDDNPFERNMVRENIPEICVPELPEDPAEYLEFLYGLDLFETASFSGEDAGRTRFYQLEAQRSQVRQTFVDENAFLKSLNMVSQAEPFNTFNAPRIAQLSQRSNQYNLRTVRYTQGDIAAIAGSDEYHGFGFTLKDRFGDNGLICAVVLKKADAATLFIESWFMSCRVLKRGMESFVLNTIVNYAEKHGFTYLRGEYIPTAKNEMARTHYTHLGFAPAGDHWVLNMAGYEQRDCHIANK